MPKIAPKYLIAFILMIQACAHTPPSSHSIFHTFRLKPGDDISAAIEKFATDHQIKAASVVTVVGSLTQAMIRFANQKESTLVKKNLEIVSFTGTVSINGSHLHLSVSGPHGETVGGHLMKGSLVRTTAEITLVEFTDQNFIRIFEPLSGYPELEVQQLK